jgi:surface protein
LETLTLGNNQNEIITYTTKAFKGCEKLTSLDLSKISTSKTVNMVEMFSNTLALQKLDIRNFSDNEEGNYENMFENINNGTEMTVIIDEAKCQKISNSLPDYVKKEKPTNS